MLSLRPKSAAARAIAVCTVSAQLAMACATELEEPKVTGLFPNSFGAEQLPASAVVSGSGLNGAWSLALDERQALDRAPLAVLLNGIPLQGVVRVTDNELQIVLPVTLRTGSYSLEVRLGSFRPSVLQNALTIMPNADNSNVNTGSPPTPLPDATAGPTTLAPDSGSAVAIGTDSRAVQDAGPGTIQIPGTVCPPGQFGAAELVTINGVDPGDVWSPSLSADHYTLYFGGPGTMGEAIWKATRNDRGLSFSDATRLPNLRSGTNFGTPWITADDLSLYFYSDATEGSGERNLYVSTRPNSRAQFGMGLFLVNLNSGSRDQLPWLSQDELTIAFFSRRGGGDGNMWTATRGSTSANFGLPEELIELNSSADDGRLFITTDGLVAYFSSSRSGGLGGDDIWYAQRSTPQGTFASIQSLISVNTSNNESDVTLSSDGLEMFFAFSGPGTARFYRAMAQCDSP